MTEQELMKKVMWMEFKLQDYIKRDTFQGRGSRVQTLFNECHALWLQIAQGGRPKSSGTLSSQKAKSASLNPYAKA